LGEKKRRVREIERDRVSEIEREITPIGAHDGAVQ
jgi:hypothetical protein